MSNVVAGKRSVDASFDEHVRTHTGWHYYLVSVVSPLVASLAGGESWLEVFRDVEFFPGAPPSRQK